MSFASVKNLRSCSIWVVIMARPLFYVANCIRGWWSASFGRRCLDYIIDKGWNICIIELCCKKTCCAYRVCTSRCSRSHEMVEREEGMIIYQPGGHETTPQIKVLQRFFFGGPDPSQRMAPGVTLWLSITNTLHLHRRDKTQSQLRSQHLTLICGTRTTTQK